MFCSGGKIRKAKNLIMSGFIRSTLGKIWLKPTRKSNSKMDFWDATIDVGVQISISGPPQRFLLQKPILIPKNIFVDLLDFKVFAIFMRKYTYKLI